ncbi:MAG: hypothetical protein IJS12_08275 [Lachnospiraceae bacterium]|nr:hypothetical protein [Lachnospiraceae bacterium]
MASINPFTRTPGVAGTAFIDMHYADKIIESFESDLSSKYVYKIVGLRGSGKSVEYRKIINALTDRKGWLVYTLSSAGDPLSTLIAKLSKEPFIDDDIHSTAVSAAGSAGMDVAVLKGSAEIEVTRTAERNKLYYSAEAELSEMIQKANDEGYKVLVGIDDIAKTTDMVKFLSIWGAMLLDDKKHIYFVCTGLAKNIEDFTDEPNLTFFKRSDPIETGPLDKYEIALMYRKLLGVGEEESVKLARFTCGYAYAYQVLGSLYYDKKKEDTLEDIIPEFDKILFSDSYDLIWKSLTAAEQELVRNIVLSDTGKAADIKASMSSPSGYDSLRQRLRNKHLLNTEERGHVRVDLPRFREYIRLWHSEE